MHEDKPVAIIVTIRGDVPMIALTTMFDLAKAATPLDGIMCFEIDGSVHSDA